MLFVIPGCRILRRDCFLSNGPESRAGILGSYSSSLPVPAPLPLAEVMWPQPLVAAAIPLSWRTWRRRLPWESVQGPWVASGSEFSEVPSTLALNSGPCWCLHCFGLTKSPS